MTNKWYTINNLIEADVAEVSIFQEIGSWGITAEAFIEDFKAVKDRASIKVYLNSPGGSVFDGLAIYNMLSSVKEKLTIEVMGLAASIASVIFLAGGERIIDDGGFVVIHNPFMSTVGGSEELRKSADTLDKIREQLVNIYEANLNLPREEIEKMLDEETWLNADECLQYGFATSIDKQTKAAAALYNLESRGFKKLPKNLMRPTVAFSEMNIRDFEQLLRDAGLSRQDAVTIASKVGFKKEPVSDSPAPADIKVLDEILKVLS